MTSDELQEQLCDTWYREQSADDAHDIIWGEAFDGCTVPMSRIAEMRKLLRDAVDHIDRRTVAGVRLQETIEQFLSQ